MLINFAATLRARRLHQFDLASLLKINPSRISEIVNGRRRPDPALRQRIAELLRADPNWLFAELSYIPPLPPARLDPSMIRAHDLVGKEI